MERLILPLSLIILTNAAIAQPWLQMYPDHSRENINALVHWNGDTVFASASKYTLLRSTDGGIVWETILSEDNGHDIVRMGSNGSYLYLLSYPRSDLRGTTFSGMTSYHLIRYDPRTSIFQKVPFPLLVQGTNPYFDLDVTPDCIVLLQCSQQYVISKTTDDGMTWDHVVLPDSLAKPIPPHWYPMVLFKDRTTGILLTNSEQYSGNVPYVTRDGGLTWDFIPNIVYLRGLPNPYNYGVPKFPGMWYSDSSIILLTDNSPIVSTDEGRTWAKKPTLPFFARFVSLSQSGFGYGISDEFACYKTTDGWQSSIRVRNGDERTISPTGCQIDDQRFIMAGRYGYLTSTKDGGVTWNDEHIPKLNFSSLDSPLEFFDSMNGACIYNNRYYGRTSDRGKSWVEVTDLAQYGYGLIRHLTSDVLFMLSPSVRQDSVVVRRSTDAGKTWEVVLSYDPSEGVSVINSSGRWTRNVDSVFFAPTTKGLLVSTDRGDTWKVKDALLHLESNIPKIDMSQKDVSIAWSVFPGKSIYRSSNDGDTWEKVFTIPDSLGPLSTFSSLFVLSAQEIVALVGSSVVRSHDGGSTWQITAGQTPNTSMLGFQDGTMYGIGFGTGPYYSDRFVFRTQNYWQDRNIVYNDRSGFISLYFLTPSIGWIALNNSILHTTNGGISWTELPLPGTRSVSLQQNYPNPVAGSGSTTIPFTVTGNREVHVRIEVHDLLGRKVTTVHDKRVQPGSHSALWVTHGVSPGMYFVRIAGAESEVRKVVVR